MRDIHPSRELLARYVKDELAHPRKLRVRKHLASCTVCQRKTHKLSVESERDSGFVDYEAAFQRAAKHTFKWLDSVGDEFRLARHLLPELLQGTRNDRLERINDSRFHTLRLCQLLREQCRSAWQVDPHRAVDIAQVALALTEYLDESRYGPGSVADSRALSWAALGNSYRIVSDMEKAKWALKYAAKEQERSGDPLTEGEILSYQASLWNTIGRYDRATALLDRAVEIYRAIEDRHNEGRALIATAMVLGDSGRHKEALRAIRKGRSRMSSADPYLSFAVRHNITFYLTESGKYGEARRELEKERHRYLTLGKAQQSRLYWLEGIISEGEAQFDKAATALWKARELLVEGELGLDSAFVSLRLSLVLARQGCRNEALGLLEEVIPIFTSQKVMAEANAACLLYMRLRGN